MKPKILSNSSKNQKKVRHFYHDGNSHLNNVSAVPLNYKKDIMKAHEKNALNYLVSPSDNFIYEFTGIRLSYLLGNTSNDKKVIKYNLKNKTSKVIATTELKKMNFSSFNAYNRNNDKVYFISGNLEADTLVFDLISEKFVTDSVSVIPTPRTDGACEIFDNKIYTMGGSGNDPAQVSGSDIVEAYDTLTNTWSSKAPMPKKLQYISSSHVYNGNIYIAGGYSGSNNFTSNFSKDILIYNIANNTWTNKVNKLINNGVCLYGRIFSYIKGDRIYFTSTELMTNTTTNLVSNDINYRFHYYDITKDVFLQDFLENEFTLKSKPVYNFSGTKLYLVSDLDSDDSISNSVSEIITKTPEPSIPCVGYIEAGEQIYSAQKCKAGKDIIQPNTLTTVTSSGKVEYFNFERYLFGYIISK